MKIYIFLLFISIQVAFSKNSSYVPISVGNIFLVIPSNNTSIKTNTSQTLSTSNVLLGTD